MFQPVPASAAITTHLKSPSRVRRATFAWFRRYRKLSRLEDLPDSYLLPTVAIVGRPNVGKSALFNRLVRKRDALVYDTPGGHVTRDYREGLGQLADLAFRLLDTSGLEPAAHPSSLQGRAAALTRGVLQSSHGVLMLLDARQGLVPADEELLAWLRRHCSAPLLLLANKADTAAGRNNLDQLTADLAGVGMAPATPISATSGEGMADLYQLLQPLVDSAAQQQQQQQHTSDTFNSSSSSSSSSSNRQHVPADFRFSGQGLMQRQHQQQEQPWQQQDDELAGGDAPVAGDVQQQEAAEQAAAAAAAAAEDLEVDWLVQQQQQLAAAADADSGLDDDAAGVQSSSSSSNALQAVPEVDEDAAADGEGAAAAAAAGPLRMAILGLPNAGKSTLMNTLLGYERSLTGPEPGLTRDPTSGWLQHGALTLQLVDTAGWKRPNAAAPTQSPTATPQGGSPATAASSRDSDVVAGNAARGGAGGAATPKVLADASLAQARRALSAVHVAVLLLDAPRLLTVGQAITRLELQLAGLALAQGKALVIGLNKADAVPGGPAAAEALREQVAELLESRFLPAGRLPVVALSGLQGQGSGQLLDAVADAYSKWNKRVSAHKLRASLAKHALRFYGTGGSASLLSRVKWASQLKPRPPTFVLLLRGGDEVDEGGQRFLANVLRQSCGLQGVPLRLFLRYNKRPQAQQRQRQGQGRGRGRGRGRR